ncbi:WYL domain-containing protein [Streptomyces pseudogriseolus]|uniref:WYL domain-containing protein n=1 Tax=Streptomyces pseudogriseolus TaxID=36817 RepID=UPI003FA235D9
MKLVDRQPLTKTLADLFKAIAKQNPVTLTYIDRDGEETIRTVEGYELRTTADGDIALVAMCRLRGDERSFRLSRVVSYTVHRMAYVLTRPEPTTYERPAPQPADDAQALYYYELARDKDDADYRPRVKLTQSHTDLAA